MKINNSLRSLVGLRQVRPVGVPRDRAKIKIFPGIAQRLFQGALAVRNPAVIVQIPVVGLQPLIDSPAPGKMNTLTRYTCSRYALDSYGYPIVLR